MKTKLIILLILTTMIHTNTVNAQHSQLKRADFQQTIDGKQTDLYFLRNKNGIEIAITNFGGRVVEFWTPDKKGILKTSSSDTIMWTNISIIKVKDFWSHYRTVWQPDQQRKVYPERTNLPVTHQ